MINIENCFSAIRKIVKDEFRILEVCGRKVLDFSKNSSKKATYFFSIGMMLHSWLFDYFQITKSESF
jgi:hypothetical protein